MFGSKSRDRVVIVSRDEWEAICVDVRGLKRLADLEAQERKEQNARFAGAIDTLETRISELGSLLASVAASHERATTEFVNRLQRAEVAIGDAANARATDVALAFDRIDELERGVKTLVMANNQVAQRVTDLGASEHGVSGAQIAAIEAELAAVRGELSGRMDAQTSAIVAVAEDLKALRAERAAGVIPSLSDIASAAPAPNVEEMRKFYAGLKQSNDNPVAPELTDDERKLLARCDALTEPPALEPEREIGLIVREDLQTAPDGDGGLFVVPPDIVREAQERAQQEPV